MQPDTGNTSRPLSYRNVLFLAVPIILANLTQPLMSAVDTAVAGHLPGAQHLAGVALAFKPTIYRSLAA